MSSPTKSGVRARRRAHDAAVAVTVDGDILLNVAHFDGPDEIRAILKRALRERGRVFVGVVLSASERGEVLGWLAESAREGTGYVISRRQRRVRSRA